MNIPYFPDGHQTPPYIRSYEAECHPSTDFYDQHGQGSKKISLELTANQVCQLYVLVHYCLQSNVPNAVEQRSPYGQGIPLQFECVQLTQAGAAYPTPWQISSLVNCISHSLASETDVESLARVLSNTANGGAPEPLLNERQSQVASSLPLLATKKVCIACDTPCKNPRALRRHQVEFCERQLEWVCPECPEQTFGLQDRLNRHHFDIHATTCARGCVKHSAHHAELCKTFLSACSRMMAEKKVWGCPCCVRCFHSRAAWHDHSLSHVTENGKVVEWSFNTMVRSLLQQQDLAMICSKYDWSGCDWSRLGKDERWNLRLALERHMLPSGAEEHPAHSCLPHLEAVALYTFNLGTIHAAFVDSTETDQFHSNFASPSLSADGVSELSRNICPDPAFPSPSQGAADSGFHFGVEYNLSLATSHTTYATAESEELMTWDTFLRESFNSPVRYDTYDAHSSSGYGLSVPPPQHTAVGCMQMRQDPRNPWEQQQRQQQKQQKRQKQQQQQLQQLQQQQRACQSSRARFRRRVRKVMGGESYREQGG